MQNTLPLEEKFKNVKQALLVLAFDLFLIEKNDDYEGSEIAIVNHNMAGYLLDQIFEMDCIEHPDWEHLVRCTHSEINRFCINKLINKFTGQWPSAKGEPLYVTAFGKTNFGEPDSLFDENGDFIVDQFDIHIWTQENVANEFADFLPLERYQAVLPNGDHVQSIFRVV